MKWRSHQSRRIEKDEAESYVGKRVQVKSYRVNGALGFVKSYDRGRHHFWVWLDEPIKNLGDQKMSRWHKCNAGNCTPIEEAGE